MVKPGTSQDLHAIERKLLDAVDREYERYLQLSETQAIPQTLVKLMIEAHGVISKRLAQTHGAEERKLDRRGLMQLALDMEMELAEVKQMIQQGEMLS